jgi:hypothetical protein
MAETETFRHPVHQGRVAVAEWMDKTETETTDLSDNAYRRAAQRTDALMTEARDQGRRMKDERPLALLAWLAGTAFVLGIVVRIWRSRHS